MQLAILTAVLAALAASQGSAAPLSGVGWRLAVLGGAVLAAPLAALVSLRHVARRQLEGAEQQRVLERIHFGLISLWLLAVAVMLGVAEWPRLVRVNWRLDRWPLVDESLVLLPVLAPLFLIWAALYRLESEPPHARARAGDARSGVGRYLWLQARHYLGLILVPPLAMIAVCESLGALGVGSLSGDLVWWLAIPLLVAMLALLPLALRSLWQTTPLAAGELRAQLEAACVAKGCRVQEILVWHTQGTVANAAVTGLVRPLRYMLLTDALLAWLPPREIVAVVRHEAAHLARGHLPQRVALVALPLAMWMAAKPWCGGLDAKCAGMCAAWGVPWEALAPYALPMGMLVYAVVVVGWYSRLLEHDADLEACLTDGRFEPLAADDFRRALVRLRGGRREPRWLAWLHPTLEQRLAFLQRAEESPAATAGFRRWLAAFVAGIGLLYAACAVLACAA
jgi:Zn-dependent protease with chaperone function